MKKENAKKGKSVGMAKKKTALAFHGETDDGTSVVGIGHLRVVITRDEALWFAQGLEIDYAAQGESEDDVKKQFEDGLRGTIHEHLKRFGTIENILQPAPSEVWKEMFYDRLADLRRFSQISFHRELSDKLPQFPFDNIDYLQRELEAA